MEVQAIRMEGKEEEKKEDKDGQEEMEGEKGPLRP